MRENAGIELEKGDTHFDGGLLAVGAGNDSAHAAGNLPVGISIGPGGDGLAGLHAGDIGFVDIDFDLVGLHVHDGGDTGAGETSARGIRRDHLADLRVLGDDYAGVGSADRAIVDSLLGLV